MKVRFTKEWHGPYGVFVQGRTCELSGPMLAAAPKGSYVAVIAEEAKTKEIPSSKQQTTLADKQMVTPQNKQAQTAKKGTETDVKGKSKKTKADKQVRAD